MSNPLRIFLSPPALAGGEMEALQKVLDSNWLAPVGPALTAFESDLQAITKTPHAVALNSGTAALHLAMVLCDVQRGDHVIVSSLTHNATVNSIIYQGGIPVLIDSDPFTWNLDPNLVEDAIREGIAHNKKPKAILAVHLYGNPADLDALMALSMRYEIPLIEDAAEALGSTFRGKALGTFGWMGALSFNGNKIITTTGGGALLTAVPEMAQRALFLATQARENQPFFEHKEIGYNYRMSNLLAAFGSAQLTKLDAFLEKRRANYNKYVAFFDGLQKATGRMVAVEQAVDVNAVSNHWLSAFVLPQPDLANQLIAALYQSGIEARHIWKPMHLQPAYKHLPFFGAGHAQTIFEHGICLPSGFDLSDADFDAIFDAIHGVLPRHRA